MSDETDVKVNNAINLCKELNKTSLSILLREIGYVGDTNDDIDLGKHFELMELYDELDNFIEAAEFELSDA